MIAAIDIGNSFIKWKLWSAQGDAISSGRVAHDEVLDKLVAYLKQYPLGTLALCNVAEHAIASRLQQAFSSCEVINFKSSAYCLGVSNAYTQPERLGADRFLAVLEAYHCAGGKPACVVDLGTAVTLDVVDETGQHQGGYIVPGFALMADALQQSTEQIIVGDNSVALGYGKNTTQAVKNGISGLLASWINQELEMFQTKYSQGIIYLTGGDAEKILPLLTIKNINVYQDLLLDGLLRLAMNP